MCECVSLILADWFLLQAIFMIPTNPPPTLRKPELWSQDFQDFVSQCLVKNPDERATATQLLQVTGRSRDGWRRENSSPRLKASATSIATGSFL